MSLVNTSIKPFKAQAFHNGKFVEVTEASLKGKWSAVVFYPADFTFVCPTELGDLADFYPKFQEIGVEVYSVSTDTHFKAHTSNLRVFCESPGCWRHYRNHHECDHRSRRHDR